MLGRIDGCQELYRLKLAQSTSLPHSLRSRRIRARPQRAATVPNLSAEPAVAGRSVRADTTLSAHDRLRRADKYFAARKQATASRATMCASALVRSLICCSPTICVDHLERRRQGCASAFSSVWAGAHNAIRPLRLSRRNTQRSHTIAAVHSTGRGEKQKLRPCLGRVHLSTGGDLAASAASRPRHAQCSVPLSTIDLSAVRPSRTRQQRNLEHGTRCPQAQVQHATDERQGES